MGSINSEGFRLGTVFFGVIGFAGIAGLPFIGGDFLLAKELVCENVRAVSASSRSMERFMDVLSF